jgi:hypothetical protein
MMSIAKILLPEFDQEMAGTRKTLERIPDDKLDWKAHPKSNSIVWVGSHLVNIVSWVDLTLLKDELDIHPPGEAPLRTKALGSRQAMLDQFDANLKSARALIEATSDEAFGQNWSLLTQGKPVITLPRIGIIRSFVMNHSIHHRAYLCCNLRLNDIPVPGLYGPSGDE